MTDINSLLKEAKGLGIFNIYASGQVSPKVIQVAIDTTKCLKSNLGRPIKGRTL